MPGELVVLYADEVRVDTPRLIVSQGLDKVGTRDGSLVARLMREARWQLHLA
jgi:hypothetical protein